MFYYEHARELYERRGKMVPESDLPRLTGFRTVYGFCEEDAKTIKQSKCSKNFSRFPVHSKELLLDFDNGADDAKKWAKWCKERDLAYSLFVSGSKGYHLEIATTPFFDSRVPYSQSQLVQRLGIPADTSLFRHGSLYRLPGTIHSKTGAPKKVVESFVGNGVLSYDLCDMPEIQIVERDEDSFEQAMIRVLTNYRLPPGLYVSRTQRLFGIAREFAKAGIRSVTTEEILTTLNASWGERSKDESTINRVIRDAYKN